MAVCTVLALQASHDIAFPVGRGHCSMIEALQTILPRSSWALVQGVGASHVGTESVAEAQMPRLMAFMSEGVISPERPEGNTDQWGHIGRHGCF